MVNPTVSKVTGTLNRPIWSGGRTLYLGEIICFLIALALLFWKNRPVLKSVWFWVAAAIILLAMIIW